MSRKPRLVAVVVLSVIAGSIAGLVWLAHGARVAARRAQSKNNLRQIGLALHNYHETFRQFPPDGTARHEAASPCSWQTLILPFLDAAPYYNMLDLRYAWDHPRNVPIFRIKREIFLNPEVDVNADENGFALCHYAASSRLIQADSSVRLDDFKDGVSHTVLAGEIADGFRPWGQPGSWRDPDAPLNSGPDAFGGPGGDGTHLLMLDGSVRFVVNRAPPPVGPSKLPEGKGPEYSLGLVGRWMVQRDDTGRIVAAWVPWVNKHEDPPPVQDDDFRQLSAMRDLEFLSARPGDSDRVLEHLRGLMNLQFLSLGGDAITDEGLRRLEGLTKLRLLELRAPRVTEAGIARLKVALPACEVEWSDER